MKESFYQKHHQFFLYFYFGCGTTVLDIGLHQLSYRVLGLPNAVSVAIAWFISVLFSFLTNRKWVFEGHKETFFREACTYFLCRGSTGLFDMAFMVVTVDLLKWPSLPCKVVSNVIVIALNYILSKLVIFRQAK